MRRFTRVPGSIRNSSRSADGTTDVEVRLTARYLKGNLLFDKMGGQVFRIENGLIRRFDIR